jgi:hypothetical protein
MALTAAAAVVLGFSRTYYLRPQFQSTSLPFYLHVHGALFSAWIALFVVQTSLVAARRTDIHRRLGLTGAALAPMMVAVGVTAAIISGRRNIAAGFEREALSFFTTPLSSMMVFVVLVGSALYYRRRPETHKRLMLLATISILDAATARWPFAFATATPWAYYVLADFFMLVAVAYDVISRRRIHPAYIWGGLFVVVVQILRDVVGRTDAWRAFARVILG